MLNVSFAGLFSAAEPNAQKGKGSALMLDLN